MRVCVRAVGLCFEYASYTSSQHLVKRAIFAFVHNSAWKEQHENCIGFIPQNCKVIRQQRKNSRLKLILLIWQVEKMLIFMVKKNGRSYKQTEINSKTKLMIRWARWLSFTRALGKNWKRETNKSYFLAFTTTKLRCAYDSVASAMVRCL